MAHEKAPAIHAQCHPIVQLGLVIFSSKATVQREAVQSGALRRRGTMDGIEHDADPKSAAVVAMALIEPKQFGVEWWRREQLERSRREVEPVDAVPQRKQRRVAVQ